MLKKKLFFQMIFSVGIACASTDVVLDGLEEPLDQESVVESSQPPEKLEESLVKDVVAAEPDEATQEQSVSVLVRKEDPLDRTVGIIQTALPVSKTVEAVTQKMAAPIDPAVRTGIKSTAPSLSEVLKNINEKELAGLKMPEETPDEKAARLKRFQAHIRQGMVAKMAKAKELAVVGNVSVVKAPVKRTVGRNVAMKRPVARK